MVSKGLSLNILTLGGSGGLGRTDFGQFPLGKVVVVFKRFNFHHWHHMMPIEAPLVSHDQRVRLHLVFIKEMEWCH